MGESEAGFACQSFAALSLDPPLVLFCPSRSSATWPVIARAGHFCANVLTAGQRDLARVFGTAGVDKFAGVRWSPSPSGAPVLAGVLTWAGCAVEAVHAGGGSLRGAGPGRRTWRVRHRAAAAVLPRPLRHDGAFGRPAQVVDTLLAWPRHADWI